VLAEIERQPADNPVRFVTCAPDELRPHPSYVRHNLAVHAWQLSAVAELGDLAFREPLAVTQDRIILDGFARWTLARMQGRLTLACIEYQMSEEEALRNLLQRHRRSSGLNDFSRICLSLELEPFLQSKGRVNQQAGGEKKGLSILTKAERVDVRAEIARIAGVSVGNVTKVKQLTTTAHPDIIEALREKQLSIHRAWLWSKLPSEEQREKLWLRESKRGIGRTIRHLILHHLQKSSPPGLSIDDLSKIVSAVRAGKLDSVALVSIKIPGKIVLVTEELFRALETQEELALKCATNSQLNRF
jgi:hypothetical protein